MSNFIDVVGALWAGVTWFTFIVLMGFLFAIMVSGLQTLASHDEPQEWTLEPRDHEQPPVAEEGELVTPRLGNRREY